jgi:hypothetical protein
MANSSFSGPVRSKNGFITYRVNSSTGAETTYGTREGGAYQIGSTTGTSSILGFAPTDFFTGKGSNPDSIINPFTSGTTSVTDSLGNDIPLGSVLYYGDRVFRYGLAGGVALTAGKLVQTAVGTKADHQDLAPTAAVAAGEYEISVETAGTDLTLNQYAGGYLYVNDGAGEGQCLKIKSNPVHDHSDDPSVVITCHDALATAVATSSKVSLIADPWTAVLVAPAAETGAAMGCPVVDMAASAYGWFQTYGPAAVLTVGTIVLGHNVVRSATVAGGVAPATSDILDIVGTCMLVDVTTDYSLIKLNI